MISPIRIVKYARSASIYQSARQTQLRQNFARKSRLRTHFERSEPACRQAGNLLSIGVIIMILREVVLLA